MCVSLILIWDCETIFLQKSHICFFIFILKLKMGVSDEVK